MNPKDLSGIVIVIRIKLDDKKVIDWESRLIPRKIKETINSLKNLDHINKISYMLPEI